MNVRYLSGLLLSLFTLVVLGCGGGGGGGGASPGTGSTTLSGEVSKGPISGGDVKIFAINADGTLQSTPIPTTDGKPVTTAAPLGSYTAVINYSGPVKVVVTGGSYKDEATGATVDFTGKSLSAVVANVTGSVKVSVTPFTEMAVQKAGAALTTATIKAANTAVAIAMGLQDVDIVAATPSTTPAYMSELAIFSQAVKNTATDVAALIVKTATAIDISTGTITSSDVSTIYTTAATNAFFNLLINVPGETPVVIGSRVSAVSISAAQNPVATGKSVKISAVVNIVSGGPPADGTVVTFSASAGTLSAVTTTTNGVATATLSGINTPQTVSVSAVAGVVKSPVININFTDPLATFVITVTDNPGAHFVNNAVPISVNVANLVNVAVANTPITFAVTSGTGSLSAASTTTDANGSAAATLTSAVEGTVTVTITVGQATGSHTITFTNPNKPASIALTPDRTAGLTNNVGPVVLTAKLLPADLAIGVIADGTPVTFTIVSGAGGVLSSPTATTSGGVASVTLNSTAVGTIAVTAQANSSPLPVTSNPVSVSFTGQPTKVTVVVRTTGTLPTGTTIGGLKATVTANPSSGLTIAADPNGASSDVSLSGVGTGSTLVTNTTNVSAVTLALVNTSGIQAGEFATLVYHIAIGTFPTVNDFSVKLNGNVIDTQSSSIGGIDVAIQSVTIQ